ncbi:MAG: amidohydrolase family protein [Chloroflexota bacterium]
MIIDTHCHAGLFKYEPIESLLFHMEQNNVDKAVLIQYMGNTDNGYMVDCMNRYPGKFAAAMCVAQDDDGTQIERWHEEGIRGIRLHATSRSVTLDPLDHWRTAAQLDLVVSAPCSPAALISRDFIDAVERFSDTRIVIEHLAGLKRGAEWPFEEFREVLKLAQYPHLFIKLPGFGEFCDTTALLSAEMAENQVDLSEALQERTHPALKEIPPVAEMTLEAFGPQRMMWGSDYPPVSSREGYTLSLELPKAYFGNLSEDELGAIFGGTAEQVWGLG